MRSYILIVMGIIIAASVSGCGGRHGAVSTATPVQSAPIVNSLDGSNELGTADNLNTNWPSDQELIQRYIAAKAAKEIASAPARGASGFTALGDEVKITDLRVEAVGDEYYLSWTYRNPGDYNLDTIVNTQDYTPLAQYFGKHVSDEPAAQIVDGNGDGIVNPADIGIIALYYQRHCSSAQLYWSPDGSSFEPIYSDSTLSRLEGEPPTCRIRIPYHHEHGWFRVAPEFSYLGEGPLSDPVQHLPVEGAPIIKSVSPYRPRVYPYDTLEFSASFTAAKPYTVTWDFGEENDLLGTTSYDDEFAYAQFYKPGVNLCSLTVENAIGKATHRFVVFVESDFYTDPPVINSVNPKRSFTTDERVTFEPSGHDLYETEFYWDFGGAAEPGYPMEYKPSVEMGAPGRYYASLLVANPVGYTIYHFVINIVHGDSEVEPNNTPAQADRLPPTNTFDEFILNVSIGKQQTSIDMADWFLISVPQGQRVKTLVSEGAVVRVYDSHMVEVPESTGTSSYMRSVIFTARTSGSHYIQVVPEDAGVNTEYSLTLTNLEPSKYDDYETYRLPPQTLDFPLSEFTGSIYQYSIGEQYYSDWQDTYCFKAQVGQHLYLDITFIPNLGESKRITVILRSARENGFSSFYRTYDAEGDSQIIDEVLPYSGSYEVELYRFTGGAYDIDYELNGTLTYDNPVPYDILPHNVTVNKPTVIYVDMPGADGATYYWEFSDGASPRVSTQSRPTVTFSKVGQFAGRVTIINGGTPSVTDFAIFVDEWNREYIATMIYDSDSYDVSLTADDFGSLHLFTSDDQYFKHDDTGWSKGPDLPQRLYIWGDTISSDGSGQPVVIGRSGANLALYTLETVGWTSFLPGDPSIETESYYHYYPKLSKSLNGRFGAICKGKGINEDGYPGLVLIGAWQTDTGWEVEQLGSSNEYETIPNIGMSPDGTPYVCYKPMYTQNETGVLFHLMHWGGDGWIDEAVPAIDTPEGYSYTRTVGIYFDLDGEPHLVFNVSGNGEIREMWKNAGEWTCKTALPANGYEWQTNWSLTQDSQRQPWMLVTSFKDSSDWVGDLYVVHKDGSRWSSEAILSEAWLHNLAGLALDNDDKPHVVYSEYNQDALIHIWKD